MWSFKNKLDKPAEIVHWKVSLIFHSKYMNKD